MIITNCTWEVDNIGAKTVEITIESSDKFDAIELNKETDDYDYIVVKVPMGNIAFNFGLTSLGYTMIETQLKISKQYKQFDFEDRLVRQIYPHVTSCPVETEEGLVDVLSKITPDMFSTDRIYLDNHFSHEKSARRYRNWIRTEFYRGTSVLSHIFYNGDNVGFGFGQIKGDTHIGLLGGVYEAYQNQGLGLMTACTDFIVSHKVNRPFKVMRTSISSNNTPMLQFYNYLNFKIDNLFYVYVKHNK